MTLKLNAEKLKAMLTHCNGFRTGGKLRSVNNVLQANLVAAVGELCEIELTPSANDFTEKHNVQTQRYLGEVLSSSTEESRIMTFQQPHGIRPGANVIALGRSLQIPVGKGLLGRTLNGLGEPIDGGPPLTGCRLRSLNSSAPAALRRTNITQTLVTGQRIIDGLLTLGYGQRIGLFAGGGVGKSTLMGEIATHSTADLNVIVLVGERGREVRPFIEDSLGPEGLKRSIVIVATSDDTPLMRRQAVKTGIEIAAHFRNSGANVLFFLDSLTRLAHAQRELGLSSGEPPGMRGYPPSVFTLLANTLEQLGTNEFGSITGIITVLVDGDDLDEPVSDAARAILDGHFVMKRELASKGQYPAIDVLQSVSRLFREVTSPEHQQAATRVRQDMAAYQDVKDLIQVGLYQPGTIEDVDRAVQRMPEIERFLKQSQNECIAWETTSEQLRALAQ